MKNGIMAFLALVALSIAVGWTAQEKPDYEAEYKALTAEYQKDYNAWIKPLMDAKTPDEQKKVKLDYDKEPSKAYIPKFKELANRAKGTNAGAQSLLFVLRLSQQTGDGKSGMEAVNTLVSDFPESPMLESVAQQLGWAYGMPEEELNKALTTMAKSPHRKVQAAAKFTLGMRGLQKPNLTDAQRNDARTLFAEVQKDYADTPYSKRAEGYLFEADHLQIGMVAPDFECTDQDGKKFKLSDYRGKVVVVDFWGYW